MTNFASRNKIPLTIIIIVLWLILSLTDYKIEGEGSTPVQWLLFCSMAVSLIFIHLIAVVNDVDYEEEYYEPNLQDKQIEELTAFMAPAVMDEPEEQSEELKKLHEGWVKNADGTTSKTVFLVQPVHITQEEFEEKINNKQINMEKKSAVELKAGLPKIVGVKNYSVGGLPNKYRAIYQDVCGFATSGEFKTYDELLKKVRHHGHPFKEDRPEPGVIAFELPFIRLPREGYFGVSE